MYIYLAYTHYILSKYQKIIIKLVWYNLLCVITAPAKTHCEMFNHLSW